MATQPEHAKQWKSNHDFLAKLVEENQHPDWIVTVAFYTALHSIRRYVAHRGHNPDTHGKLMALIKDPAGLKVKLGSIEPDYKRMQDISEDARYRYIWPTPEKIQLQLDNLKKIDEHINSILPAHLKPKNT